MSGKSLPPGNVSCVRLGQSYSLHIVKDIVYPPLLWSASWSGSRNSHQQGNVDHGVGFLTKNTTKPDQASFDNFFIDRANLHPLSDFGISDMLEKGDSERASDHFHFSYVKEVVSSL